MCVYCGPKFLCSIVTFLSLLRYCHLHLSHRCRLLTILAAVLFCRSFYLIEYIQSVFISATSLYYTLRQIASRFVNIFSNKCVGRVVQSTIKNRSKASPSSPIRVPYQKTSKNNRVKTVFRKDLLSLSYLCEWEWDRLIGNLCVNKGEGRQNYFAASTIRWNWRQKLQFSCCLWVNTYTLIVSTL